MSLAHRVERLTIYLEQTDYLEQTEHRGRVPEFVDTTEQIDRFLAEVAHLMPGGLVVRQPVSVVLHRSGGPTPGAVP